MNDDIADAVSKALRRAWQLGQTYWQQADSDSYTQNARSDETQAMFMDLVTETRAAVLGHEPVTAERERCAVLCLSMSYGDSKSSQYLQGNSDMAKICACGIRKTGENSK